MRTIIMADGMSSRWKEKYKQYWYEDSKQLVKVDGEPLLHRTVRLLKENEVNDIWITSHDTRHDVEGTTRYEPQNNIEEIDKLYACRDIWNKEDITIFLWGDVYFSKDAIHKIVSIPTDDFIFFGLFHLSIFTNNGAEIFALKVKDHNKLESSLEFVRNGELPYECRRASWELYRYMNNAKNINLHLSYAHFVGIDDLTTDFDTPDEFIEWQELYKKWKPIIGD